MTEAEFQAQVVELAHLLGWRVLHVRRSIGKGQRWTTTTSIVGWPDLFMYHPDERRVLALELKAGLKSKISDEQRVVVDELNRAGITAAIVSPEDWDWIQHQLEREKF